MPVVAAAVIGTAGSLYASSQANKAAKKQAEASQYATDQSIALQKDIYGKTVAANQPFTQAGYQGLDAYLSHIGLSGGGAPTYAGTSTGTDGLGPMTDDQGAGVGYARSTGSPEQGGVQTPNYGGYLSANQDVATFASDAVAQKYAPPGWSGGVIDTPEEAAAYHYQTYGKDEGRAIDTTTTKAPTYGPDLSGVGARPTYTRPEAVGLPGAPDFSAASYVRSPGYENQLKEGQRSINAFSAARGLGQSSYAQKEAMTFGQNLADQDYQTWRQNELSTWQAKFNAAIAANNLQNQTFESDRAAGTGAFESDRGYTTGVYNTQTGNLLDVARLGQASANNTASAGSSMAANVGNALTSNAGVQADAASQRASANATAANNIAGIGQNLLSAYGVAQTPAVTSYTPTSAEGYSYVNPSSYQTAYNPGNLLRAPQVAF